MQTNIKFGTDDFFYMRNTGTSHSVPSESDCSIKYNIVPDASCNQVVINEDEQNEYNGRVNYCKTNYPTYINGCLESELELLNDKDRSAKLLKYKVWQDNSGNCYKKQLCKNRELADKVKTTESIHLGTGQKHSDVDKIYDTEYNKTIHMGLGILLLSGAIYYTVS